MEYIKELVLAFRYVNGIVTFQSESLSLDIHTKIFLGKIEACNLLQNIPVR